MLGCWIISPFPSGGWRQQLSSNPGGSWESRKDSDVGSAHSTLRARRATVPCSSVPILLPPPLPWQQAGHCSPLFCAHPPSPSLALTVGDVTVGTLGIVLASVQFIFLIQLTFFLKSRNPGFCHWHGISQSHLSWGWCLSIDRSVVLFLFFLGRPL